jgi:hypothetical protein
MNQPARFERQMPSKTLQTDRRLRTRTTRRTDLAGFGPAAARVYRSSDGQTPDVGPLTAKGKTAYKAASLACCCKAVNEVDRAVCVSAGGKNRSLLALQHFEPRCDVPGMMVARSRPP